MLTAMTDNCIGLLGLALRHVDEGSGPRVSWCGAMRSALCAMRVKQYGLGRLRLPEAVAKSAERMAQCALIVSPHYPRLSDTGSPCPRAPSRTPRARCAPAARGPSRDASCTVA